MIKGIVKIAGYTLIAIVFSVALSGCSLNNQPEIKKSSIGICHEKGTNYYKNTKSFEAYNSLEDCLDSGGRLPKK